MKWFAVSLVVCVLGAGVARADDLETCAQRRAEMIKKVADFKGDERTKRLIEADIQRAFREQAEGDGDECLEALDHAAKLLEGKI